MIAEVKGTAAASVFSFVSISQSKNIRRLSATRSVQFMSAGNFNQEPLSPPSAVCPLAHSLSPGRVHGPLRVPIKDMITNPGGHYYGEKLFPPTSSFVWLLLYCRNEGRHRALYCKHTRNLVYDSFAAHRISRLSCCNTNATFVIMRTANS